MVERVVKLDLDDWGLQTPFVVEYGGGKFTFWCEVQQAVRWLKSL